MSATDVDLELEPDSEHQVTPLELFFDLVFVFAITQVTGLMSHDPTWAGVLRGMLVLAALWWAWSVYAWLTSATDVDEGGVRHRGVGRRPRDRLPRPRGGRCRAGLAGCAGALRRAARPDHPDRARRVDHRHRRRGGTRPRCGSPGRGCARNRRRLGALVALLRRRRHLHPAPTRGGDGARAAPARASVVQLSSPAAGRRHRLFALGLERTLGHPGEALDTVPAVALCGGAALYLLAEVAILYRTTRRIFRRRTVGVVVLLALVPVALAIPALAALACVSAVCAFVVAYEAIRHREHRIHVRHPETVG